MIFASVLLIVLIIHIIIAIRWMLIKILTRWSSFSPAKLVDAGSFPACFTGKIQRVRRLSYVRNFFSVHSVGLFDWYCDEKSLSALGALEYDPASCLMPMFLADCDYHDFAQGSTVSPSTPVRERWYRRRTAGLHRRWSGSHRKAGGEKCRAAGRESFCRLPPDFPADG